MLDITRAVLNNLNQARYLKNINRVNLRNVVRETNTKNLVAPTNQYSIDGIKNLQSNIRVKNLKCFVESYSYLKIQRFFVVTLPACLTAATIAVACVPNKDVKTGKVTTYNVEHTIYNSELGQATDSYKGYDRGFWNWLFRNNVDHSKVDMKKLPFEFSSELSFKIYDGMDAFFAKFSINENGEISNTSAKTADYIDLETFDNIVFNELDSEYPIIFDKVIQMLKDSSLVSKDEEEVLDRLTESDKKTIVMEIVRYTKIGKEEVSMTKTNNQLRNIMIFFTLAYILIELAVIFINELEPGTTSELKYTNGVLEKESYATRVGLFFGPMKLREAFLAAERERILRLRREIEDNLVDDSDIKLLTRYERKLK
ncbi:MAG: hypothetical protein J1F35_02610 [Erysipelotrichales bacterium]|nr:hypothetical protein [Erysipelotrichales bacterium]